ncbi:glycosyltransferase family 39 protein [Bdellovibrio sp. HCB117]|uniref:glycosyltransferase family 39 protein n=1 Tax=Bdellovibrio sp. HCB117 TaxID=3394359 RepID=UPI0039B4BBFA
MPISSLLINFLLLLVLSYWIRENAKAQKFMSFAARAILIVAFIWLSSSALAYLITPLFFDHAEANIASVAALWRKGYPIYSELDSESRYSLLYGPWPYLVNAFFQSSGLPVIFASKLAGLANLAFLLLGTVLLGRDLKLTKKDQFYSVAMISVVLLGFYNFSYWNRPDSFLMTYVFWSLLLVTNRNVAGTWVMYLGLGILGGIAVNSKLHSLLYFAPIVALYCDEKRHQISARKIVVGVLVFLLVAMAPFLLPEVSKDSYLVWLKMASRHGLVLMDSIKNATFIACFLLLLVLIKFSQRYKITFIVLCLSSLLIAIAASKPGAGPHHFLPLIPVILWLAIKEYFGKPTEERPVYNYIFAAFLLTVSLNAVNRQKRVVELLSETTKRIEEYSDLKALLQRLPAGRIEFGFTDNKNYESTFYKAYLVNENRSLLIDGAALMDMRASMIDLPESTLEALKNCKVSYIVFPKSGEPWSILSFYKDIPLFSEEFKDLFNEKFQLLYSTDHFTIYKCRSH